MRLNMEQRHLMVDAVRRGVNKTNVASVFNTSRITVWKWCKRAYHKGREYFKDRIRRVKEKITLEVEIGILTLRNTFEWGTARIQQGLYSLPKFMLDKLKELGIKLVQGVRLSRTSINEVLKKHEINGYHNKIKTWKFFRAEKQDELWQLDIKGPFILEGKKYYFIICIDDYSRYLILSEQVDHCPAVKEITKLLEPLIKKHKPAKILTDNNPFKEEWNEWCKCNRIEPLHAHPYYPQDKGKVERTIRNVAEEFIYLIAKFPEWINGKINEYRRWYNKKRFHRGINEFPEKLYVNLRT